MPRQPNTRPTKIYYLIDMRTGVPFYCGKTVNDPIRRLARHMKDAVKWPLRANSIAVSEIGGFTNIRVIEVVPPGEDWVARETYHISELRLINPNCTNISNGGEGVPGCIPNEKTRAKIGAAHRGKKLSPEHIEFLRNIHLGSKRRPDSIAKTAAAHLGSKRPAGTGARISAANRGKIISPEAKGKMRLAKLGKKQKPEHVANMRAALTGKPKSPEHRAALVEAWKVRRARATVRGAAS